MRPYAELLSAEPAWPEIAALAAKAGARVTVLPATADSARVCLEGLQVTTRSPLGAVAHETGGILVDHGWLRLLGSGHARLARTLGGWNQTLNVPFADLMVVADDAIGGNFAINGGALGGARGNMHYFAPDTLSWQDLGFGYGAFVGWAFTGNVTKFYEGFRWRGWQAEVEALGGDRVIALYPPPSSVQGKDLSKVSRSPVPAAELWRFHVDVASRLAPKR